MGSTCRQINAGVYRSAGALVDQGIVPEHFHGADGSGEAGGDIGGHLHRRGYRAVVVGGGDDNPAGAGKGGSEVAGRGMPVLEEGHGSGRKDQEDAEDDILDKAALGTGNLGRDHKRIRTNTALSSLQKWQGST